MIERNIRPDQPQVIFVHSKNAPNYEKRLKLTLIVLIVTATIVACLIIGILISKIFSIETTTQNEADQRVRFNSRSDWLAREPVTDLPPLELPSTRVIIAHTATDNCTTQAICMDRVHTIQKWHMREGQLDDIGFNFLIGGDGAVYVGRGWDTEGVHTKGYNKKSICIAFIGAFFNNAPPKRQLYAAQKLIKEGLTLKKIAPNYSLYGQRQLIGTESPGLILYEIIKKWDHWMQ